MRRMAVRRRSCDCRAMGSLLVETLRLARRIEGRHVVEQVQGGLDNLEEDIFDAYLAPAEGTTLRFDVPEDGEYSVMVTAILQEYDPDNPAGESTSYALEINGVDSAGTKWSQNIDGKFRRKTAGSGPDVALTEGEGVTESGSRKGTFGEDLQDRIELAGAGKTAIRIAYWEPPNEEGAAKMLEFELVHAPPSRNLMWGAAIFVTLTCFFMEIRYGCERISSDIAFLMVWAIALRDGVTPLDDWQRVGAAMLPALLVGFLGVAAVSYVLTKYFSSRESSEEETEDGELYTLKS